MFKRIGLAIVIAIAVTIGCYFLGAVIGTLDDVKIAVTTGDFLKHYGAAIGILAGLYSFFTNKP